MKAFIRLGGEERGGKGSHRVVNLNGYNLSVPAGILKIGLLKKLINLSGRTDREFLENIRQEEGTMTTIMRGDAETIISLPGFTILIHESAEGETGYWGEVIELPGCVSQGETLAELRANIQEAIEAICSVTSIPDYAPYNFATWQPTETGTA